MRLIDADKMRREWLENGENEYVYDTNAVLYSIDEQPTVEVPQWIPAAKRLPEHNKKVLCRGIDGSCSVMLYNHFESGWKTGIFSTNLYCRGLITHWMPLPEPPEVGND